MTVPIRHVAVIGAGIMGTDIAVRMAARGCTVHLVARHGPSRDGFTARAEKSAADLGVVLSSLQLNLVAEIAAVPWHDLDLVIESLKEDLALKQRIFAELVEKAPPDTPLGSNSSSFPISAIGEGLRTRERMLGLHFFMPAHLVPLVEVVLSEATDRDMARRVHDQLAVLGCEPVMVHRDIPGFLANRIQHALMREVWSLIDRGIASPEDVDRAVRYGFGLRYVAAGPVLQKEMSGLEVNAAASAMVYPDLCNDDAPPPVLTEKVARGEFGMKSGKGFWEWTPERIADERNRYSRALQRALEILRDDRHED